MSAICEAPEHVRKHCLGSSFPSKRRIEERFDAMLTMADVAPTEKTLETFTIQFRIV